MTMAKEVFRPTKPHVNSNAIVRILHCPGVSQTGASQFANGSPVTASKDRKQLSTVVSRILAAELGHITGKTGQQSVVRTRSGVMIDFEDG
jgi:hypothetical protein